LPSSTSYTYSISMSVYFLFWYLWCIDIVRWTISIFHFLWFRFDLWVFIFNYGIELLDNLTPCPTTCAVFEGSELCFDFYFFYYEDGDLNLLRLSLSFLICSCCPRARPLHGFVSRYFPCAVLVRSELEVCWLPCRSTNTNTTKGLVMFQAEGTGTGEISHIRALV